MVLPLLTNKVFSYHGLSWIWGFLDQWNLASEEIGEQRYQTKKFYRRTSYSFMLKFYKYLTTKLCFCCFSKRDGQYRIDSEATPTMLNCLMYKLSYYRYEDAILMKSFVGILGFCLFIVSHSQLTTYFSVIFP